MGDGVGKGRCDAIDASDANVTGSHGRGRGQYVPGSESEQAIPFSNLPGGTARFRIANMRGSGFYAQLPASSADGYVSGSCSANTPK